MSTEALALLSLLEATIDATDEGLLVVGLNGKIAISNRRFAEIWRTPPELIARRDAGELLDFARNQLTSPDQFMRRVQTVYASRDAESSDVLEFKDGRLVVCSSRPQRVDGKVIGVVWSFRDVTAQKRAELARTEAFAKERMARADAEAERRSAEILSDASRLLAESLDFETTIQAILEINVTKIGDWSAVAVREGQTGMRIAGFRANPPDPATSERIVNTILDPEAPEGIPRVMRSGHAVIYSEVEAKDLSCDGTPWPVIGVRDPEAIAAIQKIGLRSFLVVPLTVRGKVIGAMSIASRHSTRRFGPMDLKLAEELGRRSAIALDSAFLYRDALRTIRVREDFLSAASHELRTPLSPLRMQFEMVHLFVKMIPESFEKRKDLLELMEGAGRQMDRLLKLVDNLLDVSRITAGRLSLNAEWFDLAELVREIVKRFELPFRKAGCSIELDLPGHLEGFWDPSRIDQVISNLFSNALKFGVSTPIHISLAALNGEAHFTVADHGIGIAESDRRLIFERFERAGAPLGTHGFGLGLYISREIIEAHSGKISFESELGKGAVFTVRLPILNR